MGLCGSTVWEEPDAKQYHIICHPHPLLYYPTSRSKEFKKWHCDVCGDEDGYDGRESYSCDACGFDLHRSCFSKLEGAYDNWHLSVRRTPRSMAKEGVCLFKFEKVSAGEIVISVKVTVDTPMEDPAKSRLLICADPAGTPQSGQIELISCQSEPADFKTSLSKMKAKLFFTGVGTAFKGKINFAFGETFKPANTDFDLAALKAMGYDENQVAAAAVAKAALAAAPAASSSSSSSSSSSGAAAGVASPAISASARLARVTTLIENGASLLSQGEVQKALVDWDEAKALLYYNTEKLDQNSVTKLENSRKAIREILSKKQAEEKAEKALARQKETEAKAAASAAAQSSSSSSGELPPPPSTPMVRVFIAGNELLASFAPSTALTEIIDDGDISRATKKATNNKKLKSIFIASKETKMKYKQSSDKSRVVEIAPGDYDLKWEEEEAEEAGEEKENDPSTAPRYCFISSTVNVSNDGFSVHNSKSSAVTNSFFFSTAFFDTQWKPGNKYEIHLAIDGMQQPSNSDAIFPIIGLLAKEAEPNLHDIYRYFDNRRGEWIDKPVIFGVGGKAGAGIGWCLSRGGLSSDGSTLSDWTDKTGVWRYGGKGDFGAGYALNDNYFIYHSSFGITYGRTTPPGPPVKFGSQWSFCPNFPRQFVCMRLDATNPQAPVLSYAFNGTEMGSYTIRSNLFEFGHVDVAVSTTGQQRVTVLSCGDLATNYAPNLDRYLGDAALQSLYQQLVQRDNQSRVDAKANAAANAAQQIKEMGMQPTYHN